MDDPGSLVHLHRPFPDQAELLTSKEVTGEDGAEPSPDAAPDEPTPALLTLVSESQVTLMKELDKLLAWLASQGRKVEQLRLAGSIATTTTALAIAVAVGFREPWVPPSGR